jgi:LuxR family transcriptional regulator, maltose regulon positive regulatory protein
MPERVARRYPTQPKAERKRRLAGAGSADYETASLDDVRGLALRGVDPLADDVSSPQRPERPALHPDLIRRAALLDWFSAHRTESVVAIFAGAGYGKTTLLAQADEEDARPFAWVSLDERDNDPRVFVTRLARGLGQLDGIGDQSAGVGRAVVEARGLRPGAVWSAVVPRLGAALGSINRPAVLVLDDVHVLRDHDCLNIVAALCACVPHGSQLMLAGRAEPDIGLARVRAERRLAELDTDKLALDPIEAAELLSAAGVDLPPADVAELTRRTEGWAVGLYLTALSLRQERLSRSGEPCPR